MTLCKVTKHLYYGSHPELKSTWPDVLEGYNSSWWYNILKELGFTHIINLSEKDTNDYGKALFIVLHSPKNDDLTSRGIDHWKSIISFYKEARLKNGKVLVHCLAGRSRSPATCAILLMSEGIPEEEAINYSSRFVQSVYLEDGKKIL
jgi:hypothetical protein